MKTRTMTGLAVLWAGTSLLLTGCGPVADVAGEWRVTGRFPGGAVFTDTIVISQNGSEVSARSRHGTYRGEVSGSQMTLSGPTAHHLELMTIEVTLDDIRRPSEMTGTWTLFREGFAVQSGPVTLVRLTSG